MLKINGFALLLALVCAIRSPALAQEIPSPRDANWQVSLIGIFGDAHDRRTKRKVTKDLYLDLNLVDGKVVAGVGRAPRFNRAGHTVTQATIAMTDARRFTGTISVTMNPDRWIPRDGQAQKVTGSITGRIMATEDGPTLEGTFDMTVNRQKVQGKVTGQINKRKPAANVLLSGRLFPTKIDDRDFPEMEIRIGIVDQNVAWAKIGMSWQRWPHRWHAIDVSGLVWDPTKQKLTGDSVVPERTIDIAGPADGKRRLVFDGAYVGDMFVTRITAHPTPDDPKLHAIEFNGGAPAVVDGASPQGDSPDAFEWFMQVDNKPWFIPVDDHIAVAPGEHPRILFRKNQVEQIRARAQTPEGKLMVARLRRLLGNDGQALPTQFNKTPPHNHNKSPKNQPLGTFTSFHAPGYAMLYQLTGEQKYADLAKGALDLMFEGKNDRDNRYGWAQPGTDLRVGSILASVALTYDLAYDGWSPAYRQKVAQSIANYNQPVGDGTKRTSIKRLLGRTGYPPSSNHYGSHFGGTLLAMLAIQGDPGVDQSFVADRIEEGLWMLPHMFYFGFGEGGWYQEGPHPSRLSTNGGFVMALQAIKNVMARDYISARPNGQWATLRWVMWTVPSGAGPVFVNRGTYGDDRMYGRAPMLSHSGDFVFGFGAIQDKYKPAVLWTYINNVEKPWEQGDLPPWWIKSGERSFNAMVYPMHAVFALVNWPIGVKPQNPAEVMPTHHIDKVNDYFVSRNTWKDRGDIVVSFSTGGGPWGYHRPKHRGSMIAMAYGQKYSLPAKFGHHRITEHHAADDGSFTLSTVPNFFGNQPAAIAADLSGKSGAALVMMMRVSTVDDKIKKSVAGFQQRLDRQVEENKSLRERGKPEKNFPHAQIKLLPVGKAGFVVVTVDRENLPEIRGDKTGLHVGDQHYRMQHELITFNGLGDQ